MKDLQDLKDLTIHDVQPIGDYSHQPCRKDNINQSQIGDSPCQKSWQGRIRPSGTVDLKSEMGRFGLSERVGGGWVARRLLSDKVLSNVWPELTEY
jgi:hypothetical protein